MPLDGYYSVSKTRALVIVVVFVASLIITGLCVFYLTERPAKSVPPVNTSPSSTFRPTTAKPSPSKPKDVRLPQTVLPRHYDVRLFPVLQPGNFTIIGEMSVRLECYKQTDRIVLHSADIAVDAKSVRVVDHSDDKSLMLHGIEYDVEREFLLVILCQKMKLQLVPGRSYTLSMSFVGDLNDQLKGLYRSSYQENGVTKYMAVSQMEPTDARRAFPCFDEPAMKATFTVTLGRHASMTALSNMPLKNTTAMEGTADFYWDEFEKSVPMSTYLIAFVVADFVKVESDVGNANWQFNIYARHSARNQTRYASVVGPKIQAFYEDYFQIPFPLPKQDMIAIPDFSAGAMENWGLITYRETALLYDDHVSSAANKQRVLEVVAHELAHQWFGNLVTMGWWTDLWLNEGFASYVEYLGGHHAEPTFELPQQLITADLQSVMDLDALESSHPISVVVNHPDEINEIFDRISYSKGATIIRMLASFLGEKTFKEGLTYYLTSRQYGNAVQDDLWNAFTRQAEINKIHLPTGVKQIMDTWTLKMGFPVITVNRDYDNGSVSISQERFLTRKSTAVGADNTVYRWWVPITYTADFREIGSTWLSDKEANKSLHLGSVSRANQWLIFNVDETGYFRVNYDARNWQLIAQQLAKNHSVISVINRAQIMNDAMNLAEAGQLDYPTALKLTRYLERESDYLPWASSLSSFSYIDSMMSRSPSYGLFKKHLGKIITPLYYSLGFNAKPTDSPMTVQLRIKILAWACHVGNKDCLFNARRIFGLWMAEPENGTIVNSNLKRTIACYAISQGGEAEWDFTFDRYVKSNVAGEKAVLLSALSCAKEPWILSKMLEMTLNASSGIRRQDASNVVSQVAHNPLGRYVAFDFLRDRFDDVQKAFTSTVFNSLPRIIKSVTGSFNTELELKQLERLYEENSSTLDINVRSNQQILDQVKNNINWMKRNHHRVADWLKSAHH